MLLLTAHALDAPFNANGNEEDGMKRPGKEAKVPVSSRRSVNLNVNGKPYKLAVGAMRGAVAPSDTLLYTIRETRASREPRRVATRAVAALAPSSWMASRFYPV
jgi:hypothetical protein